LDPFLVLRSYYKSNSTDSRPVSTETSGFKLSAEFFYRIE